MKTITITTLLKWVLQVQVIYRDLVIIIIAGDAIFHTKTRAETADIFSVLIAKDVVIVRARIDFVDCIIDFAGDNGEGKDDDDDSHNDSSS